MYENFEDIEVILTVEGESELCGGERAGCGVKIVQTSGAKTSRGSDTHVIRGHSQPRRRA